MPIEEDVASGQIPVWMVGAALTTLTGAIAVLWKMWNVSVSERIAELKTDVENQTLKLDKCEEDHDATRKQFIEVNREVGELSGRLAGLELAHQSVFDALVKDTKSDEGS